MKAEAKAATASKTEMKTAATSEAKMAAEEKSEMESLVESKAESDAALENASESETQTGLPRGWMMIKGRGNLCIRFAGGRRHIRQGRCNRHRNVHINMIFKKFKHFFFTFNIFCTGISQPFFITYKFSC